jgi:hypothetical protein
MKHDLSLVSRRTPLGLLLTFLFGLILVGLLGRSVSQPPVTVLSNGSTTTAYGSEREVGNDRYTRIELADVKSHASTTANNLEVSPAGWISLIDYRILSRGVEKVSRETRRGRAPMTWRIAARPAVVVAAFYGAVAVSLLSTHTWDPRFFATVGPA